jgi:hypothetical protein
MTDYTIQSLVETRKRVVLLVNAKKIPVSDGAELLGISRQGLWKLRKNVEKYGMERGIRGRKRGPMPGSVSWNRVPKWIEEQVESLWDDTGAGPDRLVWFLEDEGVEISRSTVYRILIRRKLISVKSKGAKKQVKLYTKGYPGEEVQIDTTEPFGKSKGTLICGIDDYSRWAEAGLYYGNTSMLAGMYLREYIRKVPFPVTAVRVDNGSEFKKDFIKTCKELGIKIIRNPYRSPEKNGKVERLHRTIQEECLWKVEKESLTYGKYYLNRYLSWYNTVRRHGGYGMDKRTPRGQIEKWIIDNSITHPFYRDVNLTMILYKTRILASIAL